MKGFLPSDPADSADDASPATVPPPTTCPGTGTITSETIAKSPENRARKKLGVGEEVKLSVSPGPANWRIAVGTGKIRPGGSQSTVVFSASGDSGPVVIEATGAGCTSTIDFEVVQPTRWVMQREPGTGLEHTSGRPDVGWNGRLFIHPADVNYYNVETREKDSSYVGSGSYGMYTGSMHGNYPTPEQVSQWIPTTTHSSNGSSNAAIDFVYTGDPGPEITGEAPPFKTGKGHFPIEFQWRVVGDSTVYSFPIRRQEDEIFANGRCESKKGGNTEFTMYNDPSSTP